MNKQAWIRRLLTLTVFPFWLSCGQQAEEVAEVAEPAETEPAKPVPGDMVLIPAGEFIMGTDKTMETLPPLAEPQHTAEVAAFYIDVYEVTHGQWMKFTTESDYRPRGNWRQYYNIGKEDYPVANVIWEDAQAYCEWAGKRLPTEKEWEKAARGTEGLRYPWGEVWDPTKSNCNELGYRNTIEVGSMETDKSPYGVYDMMGNAQEWTADKLQPYEGSPARRHEAFRKGFIAVRGGSYAMKGRGMGLYTRTGYLADVQYGVSFRCARDAESPEAGEAASAAP